MRRAVDLDALEVTSEAGEGRYVFWRCDDYVLV
jgi:hypothetical protein